MTRSDKVIEVFKHKKLSLRSFAKFLNMNHATVDYWLKGGEPRDESWEKVKSYILIELQKRRENETKQSYCY